MKRYNFNKLIRNKLPARFKLEGIKLVGKTLTTVEFALELKNKLVEESKEVLEAEGQNELIKELADVVEVINTIKQVYNITSEEVEQERQKKHDINGHFLPTNFVNYIEVPESKEEIKKYLENKKRPYEYHD